MRRYRHGWQPYKGVSREVDADSLIRRLLRASDPTAPRSGVTPQVIAEKIGKKLLEHERCSEDTVAGRMGTGFESGDRATLSVEHDDLRVVVNISVHDLCADDDLDFDVDEPSDFGADDLSGDER